MHKFIILSILSFSATSGFAVEFERLKCGHSSGFLEYQNVLTVQGDSISYETDNLRDNYTVFEENYKALLSPLNLKEKEFAQHWKVTADFDAENCELSARTPGDFICERENGQLKLSRKGKSKLVDFKSLKVTGKRTKLKDEPGILFTIAVTYANGAKAEVSGRPMIFQEQFSDAGQSAVVTRCFLDDSLELVK